MAPAVRNFCSTASKLFFGDAATCNDLRVKVARVMTYVALPTIGGFVGAYANVERSLIERDHKINLTARRLRLLEETLGIYRDKS